MLIFALPIILTEFLLSNFQPTKIPLSLHATNAVGTKFRFLKQLIWACYYFYWCIDLYISKVLSTAATQGNLRKLASFFRIGVALFSLWVTVLIAEHLLLVESAPISNLITTSNAIFLSHKIYTISKLYNFMQTLNRDERLLPSLSENDVAEFCSGKPTQAYTDFSWVSYDTRFEIPKEDFAIHKELSQGYGANHPVYQAVQVHQGQVTASGHFLAAGERSVIPVALKRHTVNEKLGIETFKERLLELKMIMFLGSHPNIVQLIGACTADIIYGKLDVIFEYSPDTDLGAYLQGKRQYFTPKSHCFDHNLYFYHSPQDDASTSTDYFKPTTSHLVKWSIDIARGMDFLHSKRIVHTDLAARNIILSTNKIAKISDFGFARQLYDPKPFTQSRPKQLFWRWVAPESLKEPPVFIFQSDIWSYGVTLWEIFSLGSLPYPGIDFHHQNAFNLITTSSLPQPPYAPQKLYDSVMKHCWKFMPMSRIYWTEIITELDSFLKEIQKHDQCSGSVCELRNPPPTTPQFLRSCSGQGRKHKKCRNHASLKRIPFNTNSLPLECCLLS